MPAPVFEFEVEYESVVAFSVLYPEISFELPVP